MPTCFPVRNGCKESTDHDFWEGALWAFIATLLEWSSGDGGGVGGDDKGMGWWR